MTNTLFYGDNLHVLRDHVASESVDLIYLDPPFNSNANYNILFRSPKGAAADSQIEAFEDTWHYGPEAARAFHEATTGPNSDIASLLRAMQDFLGQNDMMAYLAMMAVRLIELHRVLKPTGSLYLHCDPTASHYLKLLLDAVFGLAAYQAEIVWRRTNARSTSGKWPRLHDTILHYARSPEATFHVQHADAGAGRLPHTLIRWKDGLKYNTYELTGAGITRDGESGRTWRDFDPTPLGRHWGYGFAQLDAWDAAGLIHFPANGGFPRRRAEAPFDPTSRKAVVGDVWSDIDRLNQTAKERLGYPTQKPVALLERIVSASSNPGDIVLDPFCGCGTAVHAAQKLGRRWIGIDVTYLAVGLIERRLKEAFPEIAFNVVGEPKDLADAQHLATVEPHQFQYWVMQKIGGQPWRGGRKGADRGIDGYIYYTRNDPAPGRSGTEAAIVSVKAGRNVGVAMVRDLRGVLEREKADLGVFVCVTLPTREMEREAAAAGVWRDPVTGVDYPRLQLFTLAELFKGRLPYLPLLDRQAGYRRAAREAKADQARLL